MTEPLPVGIHHGVEKSLTQRHEVANLASALNRLKKQMTNELPTPLHGCRSFARDSLHGFGVGLFVFV